MENKNAQKAGNNSNQLQLTNCNVYFNITEEKLDEIVNNSEVLNTLNNNGAVVQKKIEDRKEMFVKKLLPELVEDEALDSLKEPEVLRAIKETIAQAVCTDNDKNYDLLLKLLRNRIKHSNDSLIALSLKNATEAANYITDEALIGLTTVFLMEKYKPIYSMVIEGLEVLNNMFGIVDLDRLPVGNIWIEQLDVLKLARINSVGGMKKIIDYYSEKLSGYLCVGIKKNSEKYNEAVDILLKANLTKDVMVDHELNAEYVRLPLASLDHFNGLCLRVPTGGGLIMHLSNEQQQAYEKIIQLYDKNDVILGENKKRFIEMWNQFPNLVKLRNWWDKVTVSFDVTMVGRMLAYTNINNVNECVGLPKIELKDLIK